MVLMARTAAARPYQYLAKLTLAQMLYESGRPGLAEAQTMSLLEDTRSIAGPYLLLARLHTDRGEWDQALEMLHEAEGKQFVNAESPQVMHHLYGRIIGRDPERIEEAFGHFLQVLKRPGSAHHVAAILAAAEMYGNAGDTVKQRAQLVRGLEFHPDHPRLRAALDALEAPDDE